jgi:hypothetical protein
MSLGSMRMYGGRPRVTGRGEALTSTYSPVTYHETAARTELPCGFALSPRVGAVVDTHASSASPGVGAVVVVRSMLRPAVSLLCALFVACGDSGGGDTSSTSVSDGRGSTMGPSGEGSSGPGGDVTGTLDTSGDEAGPTSSGEVDPTTGGAASTDDTGSTTGAPPRPVVLIYRGNGGEQPSGDYFRFDLLTERLTAAGKTVTDTDAWPASFDDVSLVMLVVNAEPFDAAQVADLGAVLAAGGVVIVSNEWSSYAESENLNAVLAGLVSGLSFEDTLAGGGGTVTVDGVAGHPLMAGVASMVVAASSAVLGCDGGGELLSDDGVCLMAAEPHDAGLLLAFGDTDILDDHALSAAAQDQNFAFLANLITALP